MNKVTVSGRVTRDPELALQGKQVRLSIAEGGKSKKRDDGTWEQDPYNMPIFWNCQAWIKEDGSGPARTLLDLRKGQEVEVTGYLQASLYKEKTYQNLVVQTAGLPKPKPERVGAAKAEERRQVSSSQVDPEDIPF